VFNLPLWAYGARQYFSMTEIGILNQLFDHVYVVTIARATERHRYLAQSLKGLDYELFMGADASQFSLEGLEASGLYSERQSIINHRYGKALTGGALGCSWSHRMVYEDILAKGFQRVLILEDDVVINQDALQQLPAAWMELPADWQLLFLDYSKNEKQPLFGFLKQSWYHAQRAFSSLTYSHTTIRNLYAKPFSKHWLHAGFHDYSDAYAVSGTGAAALLQLQTPIQWLADNLLAVAATSKKLYAFSIRPRLFSQTSQPGGSAQSLVQQG
jgi:glycosyl transferase family 25